MAEEKKGFFKRLAEGLTKTRNNIVAGIDAVFHGFSAIDDDFYDEIEEILVMGDIGINATTAIIENLKKKVKEQHIKEPSECKQLLINSIKEQMRVEDTAYRFEHETSVVLVIGVNGVGKTTSVGKLAGKLKDQGKKVVLAAADTFRAAASEQLTENHPYNLFVATFIGTPMMNLFDAELVKENGKYAVKLAGVTTVLSDEKQEKLAANEVEPQQIVLGVRPEHIELDKNGIEGTVDVSEMMGSSVHLHVSALGQDVVMVVSTMNMTGAEVAALANGNPVGFNFAGHVCHVFNKETGINLEA